MVMIVYIYKYNIYICIYLLSDNRAWHLAISLRWFLRFKVEISHYILYKQRSPAGWVGEWPGFCGKQHASRSHFLVTLRHCHNCCGYVDFTCLLVRFVFFWFDGVQYSLSIFRKPWSISLHPQPRWFHNRPLNLRWKLQLWPCPSGAISFLGGFVSLWHNLCVNR
jgi:hypothetical protein